MTLEMLRAAMREDVLRLAERHGARNLRVFGSVARGEAKDAGDVDLLVDWEPGRSLLDHVALVQDLEELLRTRVHIGTERSLHWYVRDKILREATPLNDDSLYLYHVLERGQRIARFIARGRETFMAAEELQDAVIRNIEVIGEAAKRASPKSRSDC